MSLFSPGTSALDALFSLNADTCNYKRGATVLATGIPCKTGKTLFRVDDLAEGVAMRVDAKDFIVRRSDISSDPVKGDVIVSDSREWRVYAPSGEPCFKPHTKLTWRIHTVMDKAVSE